MQTKYFFTPEIDERIRRTYRTNTERGVVIRLAKSINMPKWRVVKRAREIEAFEPMTKYPNRKQSDVTSKKMDLTELVQGLF